MADHRPEEPAARKLKKAEGIDSIKLIENPDILKWFGKNRRPGQVIVGFALETNNELENAKEKLKRKNLDLIVLNSLKDKGAGFKGDTNKVTFIESTGQVTEHSLKSKTDVASDLLNKIIENSHA